MSRLALLAALLLVPLAQAGGPEVPVQGEVSFAADAVLEGDATFLAQHGGLDLAAATTAGEPYVLSWTKATGSLVTQGWTDADAPAGRHYRQDENPNSTRLDWGPGVLRGATCLGRCEALLLVDGEGTLALSGPVSAPLGWLAQPEIHWASWDKPREGAFSRIFPAGDFAFGRTLDAPVPSMAGHVVLFLKNVTADVSADGGGFLDTTARRSPLASVPGLLATESVQSRFALLDLEGASFQRAPRHGVELLASSPEVRLQGALLTRSGTGHLSYAGRDLPLAGAPLRIDGSLVLLPSTSEVSAPLPGDPPGFSLATQVSGEAREVVVGGATLHALPSARGGAGWVAMGVVVAAWWLLQRALVAPFYSRIGPDDALANANRARIHALIAAQPGVTAAQLRRATGLARVVVNHHLRILADHRLVSSERDGRRRRYFVRAAGLDRAQLLLEDASRRKLVAALALAEGPLTQREIAARTGLSQRLVSHHLAKLAAAGVVGLRSERPARYVLERRDLARAPREDEDAAASGS